MQELNIKLSDYLNSYMEYEIIEKIVIFLSDFPIFFIPVFLMFTWIYFTFKEKDNERKKDLLFIFYACIIAMIISLTIQFIHFTPRPEAAWVGAWKLVMFNIPDASFPSNHATVSIAFLTSLFLAKYRIIAFLFLVPAILMNLSRVTMQLHWPFDIVWWTIVWIVWAFITFKLIKKIKVVDKFNDLIIKIASFIKL
jgi:undecaprenyl-diphosphatase